jgi:hypothetical protein
MPCPVCTKSIQSGADHRMCVFKLFDENKIQSVDEWEQMSEDKPKTIVKGRVRIRVKKE